MKKSDFFADDSKFAYALFSSRCSGRSYSKDSQKSSQSDLSMASAGGGSPKLLAKTPLREYTFLFYYNCIYIYVHE